ncbi:Beta-barrel assembly machine subunit BamF [Thalassovita litoralis]|jgi:hypothetical protein|uniref:Beta-barrel assembly machine subunit BamF n=2 Tax=Thalassovita litoralis TaxID=1010611 RepID=A0A521CGA7_9RHOB|nr:Beta-barrel assembly machine subunit BamF [Thalassovita litoralis]
MRMSRAVFLLAFVGLAACGGDARLRDLRSFTGGPDEFSVIPGKELQSPKDYASLPTPTPGGSNLTDPNPRADAVKALGGKPGALVPGGVPTSEVGLVNYVSRNGVAPAIRQELATEDEQFRKRQSRFTKIRITRIDRYNQAYRKQRLNAYKEAARWRAAGANVPSAPPEDH